VHGLKRREAGNALAPALFDDWLLLAPRPALLMARDWDPMSEERFRVDPLPTSSSFSNWDTMHDESLGKVLWSIPTLSLPRISNPQVQSEDPHLPPSFPLSQARDATCFSTSTLEMEAMVFEVSEHQLQALL
jgi:hypothetical protein